jgi:hypothetical protein
MFGISKARPMTLLAVVFVMLYVAQADMAETTLQLINDEFAEEIWGSERDFWGLIDTMYEEELINHIPPMYKLVLLLNNTYTSELSFHSISVSSNLEKTEFTIEDHVRAMDVNTTEVSELLITAASEANYTGFSIVDGPYE